MLLLLPASMGGHEGPVVAWQRFAGDGDAAVAMMIDEKVREYFRADEKGGVPAVKLVTSFRQGLRHLDQARQARVLGAPLAACGWVWPLHRLVKDGKKGSAARCRTDANCDKHCFRKSPERLERDKGIEPSPRPWQGRVLPLYESRPENYL